MGFDLWSLVCGETKTLGEYVTEEAIHFIAAKKKRETGRGWAAAPVP